MTEDASRTRNGLLFGVGAYLIWGVLPIYFRALGHTLPTELVAHRIVWSILFLVVIVTLLRQWPSILAAMKSPRAMLMLSTTALLIACNWLVFIWAVDNGHVLEASLGYYLNPLVNVLIGVILLKEPLSRAQLAAVALAAVGVAVLALGSGHGIWISMTLAASFAIYGFIRKIAPVESLQGLSIETALLAPIALAWILWLESTGQGSFTATPTTTWLLVLAGPITATPLLLFAAAARRLPYSTLGFLQYIAPTMQFLTAVLLFGEHLSRSHLICFGAIWTALVIFASEGIRIGRPRRASGPRRSRLRLAAPPPNAHDGAMLNFFP